MDMDIRREVEISRYQRPAFIVGTEMGELYLAMKNRWGRVKEPFCSMFDAGLFYSLGVRHGIQKERERNKRRRQKSSGREAMER